MATSVDSPLTPNYYAIIPAHVRYCKTLEPHAKLLYGEITALAQSQGYCWASNEYFAELYDVDVRTIKRWIQSLKSEKFIAIQVEKNGIQTKRKIWISLEIKKISTKGQKCPPGGTKMSPILLNKNKQEEEKKSTKEKDAPSAEASALATFFVSKVKEKKPDYSKGVSPHWLKTCERLLKLRSVEKLKQLVEFAMNHEFWFQNILSPEKLLKHLDTLEIEMAKPASNKSKAIDQERNRELSKKIDQKHGTGNDKRIHVTVNPDKIIMQGVYGASPKIYEVKFTEHGFKDQVFSILRKFNLSVEGLE